MVVIQPEKPGEPMRRPLGMTTSLSTSSTAWAPCPWRGKDSLSAARQTERRPVGSGPSSKRRNVSRGPSTCSTAALRPVVMAASVLGRRSKGLVGGPNALLLGWCWVFGGFRGAHARVGGVGEGWGEESGDGADAPVPRELDDVEALGQQRAIDLDSAPVEAAAVVMHIHRAGS